MSTLDPTLLKCNERRYSNIEERTAGKESDIFIRGRITQGKDRALLFKVGTTSKGGKVATGVKAIEEGTNSTGRTATGEEAE